MRGGQNGEVKNDDVDVYGGVKAHTMCVGEGANVNGV